MTRSTRADDGAPCIRADGGFCLLALWGNPKCFSGPDGIRCDEIDGDAAYARLIDDAKGRLKADPAAVERSLQR